MPVTDQQISFLNSDTFQKIKMNAVNRQRTLARIPDLVKLLIKKENEKTKAKNEVKKALNRINLSKRQKSPMLKSY